VAVPIFYIFAIFLIFYVSFFSHKSLRNSRAEQDCDCPYFILSNAAIAL